MCLLSFQSHNSKENIFLLLGRFFFDRTIFLLSFVLSDNTKETSNWIVVYWIDCISVLHLTFSNTRSKKINDQKPYLYWCLPGIWQETIHEDETITFDGWSTRIKKSKKKKVQKKIRWARRKKQRKPTITTTKTKKAK